MHYIYSTATVSHTLDLIIKYDDTCIQFDRQLKTSSDLIEYLAAVTHLTQLIKLLKTETSASVAVIRILEDPL
ncbi:unnamed protein product, partial [Rotaria socialis]